MIHLNIINSTKIIITDKSSNELERDLLLDVFINDYKNYVVFPYKYVFAYNPKKEWSRASLLDAENQVWHPFVNWKNYAWDFDYFRGIIFTEGPNAKTMIPINIKDTNKYIYSIA